MSLLPLVDKGLSMKGAALIGDGRNDTASCAVRRMYDSPVFESVMDFSEMDSRPLGGSKMRDYRCRISHCCVQYMARWCLP